MGDITNEVKKESRKFHDSHSEDCFRILNKSLLNSQSQDAFSGRYFFLAKKWFIDECKSRRKFRWIADTYPCGNLEVIHWCSAWMTCDIIEAKFICQTLNRDCPEYEWIVVQHMKIEELKEV